MRAGPAFGTVRGRVGQCLCGVWCRKGDLVERSEWCFEVKGKRGWLVRMQGVGRVAGGVTVTTVAFFSSADADGSPCTTHPRRQLTAAAEGRGGEKTGI